MRFQKKKTGNSGKFETTVHAQDAFCQLAPSLSLSYKALSNYMDDAYIILSVLKSRWWLPITFQNFVIVLINDGNRAEWGTIRRNHTSD